MVLSGPVQVSTCQVGSPADSGGGARLSPEKAGGKSAGGVAPWTPTFYSPLATRSLVLVLEAQRGGSWAISEPTYVP